MQSSELANDNSKNEKNKNRDYSNGNHPIRSHPKVNGNMLEKRTSKSHFGYELRTEIGVTVPTRHAPERLDTTVDISFALEQHVRRVLDDIALAFQIGERACANRLCIVGKCLAVLEALCASVQTVGARQQLLALLQLNISAAWVIRVAATKQSSAVICQSTQLALVSIDIRFVVAEALIDAHAARRGDVLFLELHLADLSGEIC